jgi:nucleoid-associated protein YgaU
MPEANPPTGTTAPRGTPYVVARGDTLTRISRHFYGSATHANMERIIAANSRLKDIKTPLMAGETLVIPGAQTAAAAPAQAVRPEPRAVGRTVIGQPGHTRLRVQPTAAPAAPAAHAVAAPAATTYTVQRGDTLASIAKRLLGSSSHATVARLAAANGIKDVNTVRVGQVLRIK